MKRVIAIVLVASGILAILGIACASLPVRETMDGRFIESKADYLNYVAELEDKVESLQKSLDEKSADLVKVRQDLQKRADDLGKCREDLSSANSKILALEERPKERWSSYTDSSAGYAIEYPPGWGVERESKVKVERIYILSPRDGPWATAVVSSRPAGLLTIADTLRIFKKVWAESYDDFKVVWEGDLEPGKHKRVVYSCVSDGTSYVGGFECLWKPNRTYELDWQAPADGPLIETCNAIVASFTLLAETD